VVAILVGLKRTQETMLSFVNDGVTVTLKKVAIRRRGSARLSRTPRAERPATEGRLLAGFVPRVRHRTGGTKGLAFASGFGGNVYSFSQRPKSPGRSTLQEAIRDSAWATGEAC
jgi:hypothetical protein